MNQLQELHRRAIEMRRNPTEPEKRLWRNLSNGQLDGHKFRRQAVIGCYIADFLCPQKALIVEVDGDTHDEAKDRLRDDILSARGYRVVRVTNDDVMTNIDGVLQHILISVSQTPPRWNNPHPNPSPEGEGLPDALHLSPSPSGEGDPSLSPSPLREGFGVGNVIPHQPQAN
ncbi:MAG TPA: endonuclease domain-containing protein [Allosphingosinicella sp.]|nr:endonuclease domain-containing protein [Allosphingosinicella sp.]